MPIVLHHRWSRLRRLVGRALAAAMLLTAVAVAAYQGGFRVNLTPSLPLGLYRVVGSEGALPGRDPLLAREEIVLFCLPDAFAERAIERGYVSPTGFGADACPVPHRALGKRILAVPGDEVRLDRDGFVVNGRRVTGTVPLLVDTRHRPMHPLHEHGPFVTRVQPHELWVYADHHPSSLDSRYFGAVPLDHVLERVRPVWTF